MKKEQRKKEVKFEFAETATLPGIDIPRSTIGNETENAIGDETEKMRTLTVQEVEDVLKNPPRPK